MRLTAANSNTCCDSCSGGKPCDKGKGGAVLVVANKNGKGPLKMVAANLGFSQSELQDYERRGFIRYGGAGNSPWRMRSWIASGAFNGIELSKHAAEKTNEYQPSLDIGKEILYVPWHRELTDCLKPGILSQDGGCWEWVAAPFSIWKMNRSSSLVQEIITQVNTAKGRIPNWTPELQVVMDADAAKAKSRSDATAAWDEEDRRNKERDEKRRAGITQAAPTGQKRDIGSMLLTKSKLAAIPPNPNFQTLPWTTLVVHGVNAGLLRRDGNTPMEAFEPSAQISFKKRNGELIPLELLDTTSGYAIWGLEGEEGVLAVMFKYLGDYQKQIAGKPGKIAGTFGDGPGQFSPPQRAIRVVLIENSGALSDYLAPVQE